MIDGCSGLCNCTYCYKLGISYFHSLKLILSLLFFFLHHVNVWMHLHVLDLSNKALFILKREVSCVLCLQVKVLCYLIVFSLYFGILISSAEFMLYGLFSESPWNSESVQIPYKVINDSLWAKLTCFPLNYILRYVLRYTVNSSWGGSANILSRVSVRSDSVPGDFIQTETEEEQTACWLLHWSWRSAVWRLY